MDRSEVVDKIAQFLGAYEVLTRSRGKRDVEAGDAIRNGCSVLVTRFIDGCDEAVEEQRNDEIPRTRPAPRRRGTKRMPEHDVKEENADGED